MPISRTLSTALALLTASAAFGAGDGPVGIDPDSRTGASKAVMFPGGDLIYTGELVAPLRKTRTTPGQQAEDLMGLLQGLLEQNGRAGAIPVRLEWCVRSAEMIGEIQGVMAARFADASAPKPAVSFAVGRLADGSANLAVNGIYWQPAGTKANPATDSTQIPSKIRILPSGGTVYVSGQSEKGGTTRESAARTIASLMKTLDFLKLQKSDAVQFKVFLQPIAESGEVMTAFAEAYGGESAVPPVVFVEWLGKPSLEIELVAASPANPAAESLEFQTPPGMTESPVFCRVVRANVPARIFFSSITSSRGGDGTAQTENVFDQLGEVLKKTSSDFEHLAKATYFVTDDATSKALGELRPRYYHPKRPPAASKAVVTGTGFEGRTLSLDMIAVPK